ncbi:MAG TPA: competence/damage-inducible protein A [Alphaproteobacteria bacterium]|nr:competence/damage-inducible protein A [Alphaproteobacteria bacterium]
MTAPTPPAKTAAMLVIGNEILTGRTKDANLPFVAERCMGLGIRLLEARVVPDVEAEIVGAVNALRARYDYVFTSGGIGPTHDDITAECIAKAFGVALERNPEAVRRLEAHYGDPALLNEARLRMANIPAGGVLIDNPISQAPGFQIGNVFVMAGVPKIMQAMFGGIVDRLVGGPPIRTVSVTGAFAEGMVATALGEIAAGHPDLDIGSYPFLRAGKIGTSLVLRGTDPARLDAATAAVVALVRGQGVEPEVERD